MDTKNRITSPGETQKVGVKTKAQISEIDSLGIITTEDPMGKTIIIIIRIIVNLNCKESERKI